MDNINRIPRSLGGYCQCGEGGIRSFISSLQSSHPCEDWNDVIIYWSIVSRYKNTPPDRSAGGSIFVLIRGAGRVLGRHHLARYHPRPCSVGE